MLNLFNNVAKEISGFTKEELLEIKNKLANFESKNAGESEIEEYNNTKAPDIDKIFRISIERGSLRSALVKTILYSSIPGMLVKTVFSVSGLINVPLIFTISPVR